MLVVDRYKQSPPNSFIPRNQPWTQYINSLNWMNSSCFEFKQFGSFYRAGKLRNSLFVVDSSRCRYIIKEIKKNGKGNVSVQIFTFQELCIAPQNFNSDSMLGEGGSGKVYKGKLDSKNKVNSL